MSLTSFGQSGDAEITGLVKDQSSAPIAATLSLVNEDSGVTRSTVGDAEGRYRFVSLPPGRYTLKTEAPGFKVETAKGFVLSIGTRVDHVVTLTLGSVQDAITVTGEVPPVDTSRGEVAGVVTQQQIDSLPVNTRQFLNLALLMPGTTQDASRSFYNNVEIGGGGRFYANGFSVDGVTNTWAEQGEPRQNIPEGAVQEFKVNTSQFKPEAGLAMGGFVAVVTKSGTNAFHGDAFEYFRDSALNHDNRFTEAALQQAGVSGKAPFRRNQFGGDVGGPILKNRTHFYAAYERTQIDDSYTIFVAPAALKFYSANVGVFNKPSYDQMLNLRLDHQLSNSQHAFARYSQEWNKQTYQGCSNASESNCYDGLIPRRSFVAGHTWTPTATLVNDFRFQYAFASFLLGPSGKNIFTDLGNYSAERLALLEPAYIFPSFRYGFGYNELGVETRWQFKDDLTLIKGNHAIKFGFDFSHIPFADDSTTNYKGSWTFSTDQTFNPKDPATIAALSKPTQFTAAIPGQYTPVPVSQYAFYVQDDWRAHRDLSITLGVRWDREVGPYNESLNVSKFAQPIPFIGDPSKRGQNANFAPRLGLAWNIKGTGKDVVRAAAGIYFNNIQTLLNFPENRNLLLCNVLITNPSYPNPYGSQSPTSFCSAAAPTVTVLDKDFAMPYSEQFSGGYSRQFASNFSIHADGVYMHTLRDWRNWDMNYPNAAGVRPLPAFARILDHKSISQSKYKALYVRAERRFSKGLQFLVSYTFSSSRDDNPQAQVTNQANYNADWGPSGIDRRNALVASGSYQLPWKVSMGVIWQLRSALPFSGFSTVQLDGVTQYVTGTTRNIGNRDNGALLTAVNAYRATLNLAAIPGSQIDSSSFSGFDLRLARPIYTKDNWKIDVIGQAFNLFGRTNLTGGSTTSATSSGFGQILGASNLQQAELAVKFTF